MQDKLYTKKPKTQNGQCPSCGFHVSHSATFESVLSGQFDNARDGSYTATRITPIRASTIEADVMVPAAQSAIWAIAVALPSVAVSVWLRYEWYFPLALASVSLLSSWFTAMKRSEASQNKIEEFSYDAAPPDSAPAHSGKSEFGIRLNVVQVENGIAHRMKLLQLSEKISEENFAGFMRDILAGKSTTRKNWTGPGKDFSRDVYDDMLSKLVSGGILRKDESGRKLLTPGGKRAIAAMVREGGI